MNIYIVTENSYFFLGLINVFNKHSVNITKIHIKELDSIYKKSDRYDIFIIDSQDIPLAITLQMSMKLKERMFLFLIKEKDAIKSFSFNGACYLNVLTDMNEYFPGVINPPRIPCVSHVNKMLTLNERVILSHIINGRSVKSISIAMGLSIKTVYIHRYNALKKIGRENFSKLTLYKDFLMEH